MWLIRTFDLHSQWISVTGESLHPWNECNDIQITHKGGPKNALRSFVKNTSKEQSSIPCSGVGAGNPDLLGLAATLGWRGLTTVHRRGEAITRAISEIFRAIFRKSGNIVSVLSCSNTDFWPKTLVIQGPILLCQLTPFVPNLLQWWR